MLNNTLNDAFTPLIPFWSNQIITSIKIGNEYSMPLNLIIGQLLKFILPYFSDVMCIIFLFIIVFLVFGYQYNLLSHFSKKSGNKYKLTLIGKENDNEINFPYEMTILNYLLIHKYNFKHIIIMNKLKDNKESFEKIEAQEEGKESIKSSENYVVDVCSNCILKDNIFLSVTRNKNAVKYILTSETTDLNIFLKKCIQEYKSFVGKNEYKYKITLAGRYYPDIHSIHFDIYMNALCHKLIYNNLYTNYSFCKNENKPFIESMDNFWFDDIVMNAHTSEVIINPKNNSQKQCIIYTLESNNVNVHEYLNNCLVEYKKHLKQVNQNILYYFKFTGYSNNNYFIFSQKVLHSLDNPNYQTFDQLHNEHIETLKKDIDKLKDIEYYKKTGLRRKKSYLFYGPPGTGKNATVVAQALYDKRHIIEIPLHFIRSSSDLDKIMNATDINGIQFEQNEVIIVFDEIDFAIDKIINENEKKEQNIVLQLQESDDEKENENTKLDLGSIQSCLDGIGNFNGLIMVAMTNYIDKIPEALKRSLRLTPIHFTYLLKEDVQKIIEKFFDINFSSEQFDKLPNQKIVASDLIVLCEKYENQNVEELLDYICSL